MRSTPKWNEELPLRPKAPLPPPRRFEIEIDGNKHTVVLRRSHFPGGPSGPRMKKSQYEIQGTSLREDELIEHAADSSKDALIVDGRGGIHRPGENFLPRNKIMSVGDAFFPPTYVGENVPTFRPGRVISRDKLHHLVRTGQIRKPPNMVNSFPPGRLIRRKKPFPPKLARQAIALTDPGAFHGLAIPTRLRVSAAFLGAALAGGKARISQDGSVYLHNEMGALKKIGKLTKKATKPVAKTAKVTAKVAVKPTTAVARVAVKPVPKVIKKPIASAAVVTAKAAKTSAKATKKATKKAAKATVNVAQQIGKWSAKQLAAAAKAVARVAATPIRLAVRPAVNAAIKKLAAGKPVTAQVKRSANALVIAQLKKHPNPLVKFSGLVLSYVGTGVSGVPTIGLALLKRDTARGRGLIVGCTLAPGQRPTVMGMTGGEIAALAQSAASALVPVVKKMAIQFAVAKGTDMLKASLSPKTRADAMPPEAQPPAAPAAEPTYPTASDYDDAQIPTAEAYETSMEPVEEPTAYEEDVETVDETSGLFSFGWAR